MHLMAYLFFVSVKRREMKYEEGFRQYFDTFRFVYLFKLLIIGNCVIEEKEDGRELSKEFGL